MNLNSIQICVVRNEYEYNKYVDAEYRKKYDYEASKASLPWIIINFDKGNWPEDIISKSKLRFTPVANFSSISESDKWSKEGTDTLVLKLDKIEKYLMLEVNKDCGYESLPLNLTATIEDNNGNAVSANNTVLDIANKTEMLKRIDEELLQGGAANKLVAEFMYEYISQLPDE